MPYMDGRGMGGDGLVTAETYSCLAVQEADIVTEIPSNPIHCEWGKKSGTIPSEVGHFDFYMCFSFIYLSSHNHGSVKNGGISNKGYVSKKTPCSPEP